MQLGAGACVAPPPDPNGPAQDAQALLALKDALAGSSDASAAASVFGTWSAGTEPCGGQAACAACRLDHVSCGAYDPSLSAVLCPWRYVQCAGGRVAGVLLDMAAAPGATTPAGPWPVFNFSGLPAALAGASSLQQLLLGSHRAVGGSLPAAWSALGALRKLSVRLEGGASGTLPAEWSAWGQIASVSVAASGALGLQGTLPAQWAAWGPSLASLALLGGGYAGGLPSQWSALGALQSLSLASLPGLGGGIPSSWQAPAAMPSLAAVNITAVPLFAPNASSLSSYYGWLSGKPLVTLALAAQGLAGAHDPALSTMFPGLRELVLSSNPGMSGAVPSEWYGFNVMRRLELAGSGLSGPLPDWLWAILAEGAALDLSRNGLSGERRRQRIGALAVLIPLCSALAWRIRAASC